MNPHKLRQMEYAPAGDSESGQGETTGMMTQAKQSITSTARETANRAKDEAQRLASEKKQDTASHIGGYGAAMHESARSLEQQDPNIAWATHKVADRVQGIADYIRERDFSQLREDAENLARRHPLAFFGGLLVAGVVIGNLLKARPESDAMMEEEDKETNWDRGNASGSEALADEPLSTPEL